MARSFPAAHVVVALGYERRGTINKFKRSTPTEPNSSKANVLVTSYLPVTNNPEQVAKMPGPCGDKCKETCKDACHCGDNCKCCDDGCGDKCTCKSGGTCSCKSCTCK